MWGPTTHRGRGIYNVSSLIMDNPSDLGEVSGVRDTSHSLFRRASKV